MKWKKIINYIDMKEVREIGVLNDLTGKTFGYLTVIRRENNNKHRQTMWKCACRCGNELIVRGYSLTTGNTISCGCAKTEMLNIRNKELGIKLRKNEVKNKYGKLTVIQLDEKATEKCQNAIWHCQCECGNYISASGVDLRRSHVMSCGCLKSQGELKIIQLLQNNLIEYIYQYSFSDLTGIQNLLKFDFAIFDKSNLDYLIEFDGIQHFTSSAYFGGELAFNRRKELDQLKNKYCVLHQIPLIRIKYTLLPTLTINDLLLKEEDSSIAERE